MCRVQAPSSLDFNEMPKYRNRIGHRVQCQSQFSLKMEMVSGVHRSDYEQMEKRLTYISMITRKMKKKKQMWKNQ